MNLRRRRTDAKLMEVVDVLLESNLMDPKVMSADDINSYLLSVIDTGHQSPMLDMNFHSQYEPTLGFRIKGIALHNLKEKAFFCALCSLMPPLSYYSAAS